MFPESFVILARKGHPLLAGEVAHEDLREARWVLPRAETPARRLLDNSFVAMDIPPPDPVVESGDLGIVRGLLLGSDMLAAVSARQLEHELESGELVQLPLDLADTHRAIGDIPCGVCCTRAGRWWGDRTVAATLLLQIPTACRCVFRHLKAEPSKSPTETWKKEWGGTHRAITW